MPPTRRKSTETTDPKDAVQGDPGTDTTAEPVAVPDEPAVVTNDEPGTVEHVDPSETTPVALEPDERERVLDDLAARAVEDDHAPASPIQQGTAVVLDATVTPDEPDDEEKERRAKLAKEQQSDEPCAEHYPDGWATVASEPGARLACEHGTWVHGQTPATKSSTESERSDDHRAELTKAVVEAARMAVDDESKMQELRNALEKLDEDSE